MGRMSIESCLPASARKHYLLVRNQKTEAARESYQAKLRDVRGKFQQSAVLRSGYQELQE
jgi:hypothetical protein